MTKIVHPRRRPTEADDVSLSTAGRREASALTIPVGDVSVRELLVAGGLRGFSPSDLIKGAA